MTCASSARAHRPASAARSPSRAVHAGRRAPGPAPPHRQACACGGTCPACRSEALDQEPEPASAHDEPAASAAIAGLAGGGHPLPASARAFLEPRLGADFAHLRVHDGPAADSASRAVRARAFTLGHDVAFAAGEFAPDTRRGRHLLAHELTHVVQQGSVAAPLVQRKQPSPPTPPGNRGATPALEFRPAINTPPCACLVFIHNDERNARVAIQALHSVCRYNLAILGSETARNREIRIRGERGSVDPNELFSPRVRTACEADIDACRTYAAGHDNRRGTRMSYYLTIRDCTNAFALPLVALHNNVISDTAAMRSHPLDPATNGDLAHRYSTAPTDDELSIADLRQRLRTIGMSRREVVRLLDRRGNTSIYRWCNAPEIGRCSVGDPANPDHVVWVVRDDDFDRLADGGFNVAQQTRAGGESDTDLSTLLLGIEDARYINIETPHTVRGTLDPVAQRLTNLDTIIGALRAAGLFCCSPAPPPANQPAPGAGQ